MQRMWPAIPLSGSLPPANLQRWNEQGSWRAIPEWHCPDNPNAIVNAFETETLKEDPDLK